MFNTSWLKLCDSFFTTFYSYLHGFLSTYYLPLNDIFHTFHLFLSSDRRNRRSFQEPPHQHTNSTLLSLLQTTDCFRVAVRAYSIWRMLFICLTIVRSYNWDLERTKNHLIRCKENRDYIVLHFFILFKETTKGVVRSSNKPQIEHSPTVRSWSSKENLIWLEENSNYIVSNFLNLYKDTTKYTSSQLIQNDRAAHISSDENHFFLLTSKRIRCNTNGHRRRVKCGFFRKWYFFL